MTTLQSAGFSTVGNVVVIADRNAVKIALGKYLRWWNTTLHKKTGASSILVSDQKQRWIVLWAKRTFDGEVAERDQGKGGSAYAFIDPENGDMYKPAGWRGPAKHVRANLLDFESAKRASGPYGFGALR